MAGYFLYKYRKTHSPANRFLLIVVFLCELFFLASCATGNKLSQVVDGTVIWLEGDRMPGISKPVRPDRPLKATIYIYSLTNVKDADVIAGYFYRNLKTRLIRKVTCNSSGHFTVKLPPGRYSIFIREKNGLFANDLDGEGNVNPVDVIKGKKTELAIRVDYKAVY